MAAKGAFLGLVLAVAGCVVCVADTVETYAKSCAVYHANGAAAASVAHDVAAWEERQKTAGSMDALVTAVENGKGVIPPKGMCGDGSPEQYKTLIEYMEAPKPE